MSLIKRIEVTEFNFMVPDIGLEQAASGVGNMSYKKGEKMTANRFAVVIYTNDGLKGEYVVHWVGTSSTLGQINMIAPLLIGRNPEDRETIYDDLSFWHTYNDVGSYTIRYYITNLYGCTDSVIKQLNINPNYSTFIPNSFTPNNDGDNDVFFPNSVGYKSYNIKILDRWGGIIFDGDNKGWDGNTNGKIIGGLYSYSITILDFKDKPFIYTGLVNLIR